MQAEVAVTLDSSVLEDNVKVVSGESTSTLNPETMLKKNQEKQPVKLDFSAYCDCV